jgi:hypothetical protein
MSESTPIEGATPPPPPTATPKPWFKRWWGITLLAFGALIVISALFGPDPEEPQASSDTPPAQQETPVEENQEEAAQEPETPDTESENVEPEEQLTIGQRNAVRSAESYLRFSAFSRTGLIGQLEFEDYSTEDATFAVDYLDVDWNEQAAKSAESYLEFSSFSRSGLIDQLMFEGFTRAEAEYGVEQVGY